VAKERGQNEYVQSTEQNPAFLKQAFMEVALKNEYESGAKTVRKWQQPIQVWIVDKTENAELHSRLTRMHLAHLSSITQHPIALANSPHEANVTLIFTTQANWAGDVNRLLGAGAAKELHHAVCIAGFSQDKQGAINRAGVVIPADQAHMHRKLTACIVEELTQIMGLPNDSEKVFPSIFNDKTPESLLTGLDALLLKMLYHPEVKIGMRAKQVMPVLDRLIAQWQQDGTIENAEKNVRQSELYELMGY
jgi:Protein of unknown function (DUF2927)